MIVGALGEIVFQVTAETVRTLDNAKWSGSARWAVHERVLRDALTEFTGRDPDQFSFDIYLSAFLGVNPMEELGKLWGYERNGTPVGLSIGDHGYGKYRWVVESHEASMETYDGNGNLTGCKVSVKLLEYLRA